MQRTYRIDGMTCNGCKAAVERRLTQLDHVTDVIVHLERGEANIRMSEHVPTHKLSAALPEKYHLTEKSASEPTPVATTFETEEESKWKQLRPLFLILLYIAVASILMYRQSLDLQAMMLDFMGLFFIVFSFFKMLDLEGFPDSFRMYDPLAKRVPVYARVCPFIETALGLMFLLRFQIAIALLATIVILGITTVGVTKTLLSKRSIRCACLGTALQLPMTEATFIKNALMLTMATTMLITLL